MVSVFLWIALFVGTFWKCRNSRESVQYCLGFSGILAVVLLLFTLDEPAETTRAAVLWVVTAGGGGSLAGVCFRRW